MNVMHLTTLVIKMSGLLVIALGDFVGLIGFKRLEVLVARGRDVPGETRQPRHAFGYCFLRGLKILIAADIIATLMRLSLQGLGVLGAIAPIRAAINFSLHAELKPEQQPKPTT